MNAALPLVTRFVLGGLFLVSGIAKVRDPIRFLFTLRDFRLFPDPLDALLALFLPWFEVVLGLCMLAGLFLGTCSLLLAGLNALFSAAIASVIARGIEIDCGCFGLLADVLHLPDAADYRAVIRNLIFIGMCAYLYRSRTMPYALDTLSGRTRGPT